jgi:hypothetical protein
VSHSFPPEMHDVLHDLALCLEALGDYAKTTVLTGGLAAALYRLRLPGSASTRPPLTTFDMDWALPGGISPSKEIGLHARMSRGSFVAFRSGPGVDPVTKYQHRRHGEHSLAGIYAEFIAPRVGSKTTRSGGNQSIIEVERDLYAQTDPYLGLLFVETVEVDLSCVPDLGLSQTRHVRLPHPLCFILQKILIRRQRKEAQKRDNDAAHIFDVATMTRPDWPEMAATLARVENSQQFPEKWFNRARRVFSEVFADPDAPGPVGVARIYRDVQVSTAPTSEDAVYRTLTAFSKAVGLSGS